MFRLNPSWNEKVMSKTIWHKRLGNSYGRDQRKTTIKNSPPPRCEGQNHPFPPWSRAWAHIRSSFPCISWPWSSVGARFQIPMSSMLNFITSYPLFVILRCYLACYNHITKVYFIQTQRQLYNTHIHIHIHTHINSYTHPLPF